MANKGQATISWPVDPETGEPMAIVSAFASEHVGSGMGIPEYCGLDIGPVGALVPCKSGPAAIQAMQEQLLRQAQFVVGSNRRAIQWSMDPTLQVLRPDDLQGQPHEERAREQEEVSSGTDVETPAPSEAEEQKPPEETSTSSAS